MFNRTSALGQIHKKTVDLLESENSKREYINYRKEFEEAASFKKLYDFPIHIDIEIDNYCNFACTFCPIGQKDNELNEYYRTIKKLDEAKVYEILDEAKKIGVKSIQFSFINEPLANKNIFKYIKYAKKLNFPDIFFVSNGYLLNEKNAQKILDSGITKIQFSLDAFSEETYKERRLKNYKPANYNKTLKNILNFLEMKTKTKSKFPLVRLSFIELETNKHEFLKFKKFWENKVDSIHYQKLVDYTKKNAESKKVSENSCNMPMFRLAIKSDGNVKPCCVGFGEKINLGNVYNDTLLSIWKSKDMRDLQKIHLEKKAYKNKVCDTCLKNTNA